jgi:hypothetical protein
MPPSKKRLQLAEALRNKFLVKFWNPYDQGSTQGYVLDIGPRFLLLGLIDGNIMFNGFQCLLLSDVKKLKVPDPFAAFIVAALHKRKQSIDKKPDIDLSSLPELLESANRLFPLVTVHRERIKPDTCIIGKVLDISKSHLLLLEIGPDAVWDKKPSKVRLTDITRVEFGGGYEEALHLVGGAPTSLKKRARKTP